MTSQFKIESYFKSLSFSILFALFSLTTLQAQDCDVNNLSANAGDNQTTTSGETVSLNGSGSSDGCVTPSQGVHFDNVRGNYIDTGYDLSWDENNAVSIAFWVRPQTVTGGNPFIGKGPDDWEWFIGADYDDLMFTYFTGTGGHSNNMIKKIDDVFEVNTWVHIGYTWNGTTSKVYVNGSMVYSWTATDPNYKDRASTVNIGGEIYMWGNKTSDSDISDVRFWDRQLSDAEMDSVKNGAAVTDDLILHYPMNQASGSTVTDASGNGNDGTLIGDATRIGSSQATFSWSQLSGTTVTLDDENAIYPTFAAPPTTETLSFELTITDPDGGTSLTDTVDIAVSFDESTFGRVAYYAFEETEGQVLVDSSAGAHNGQLGGTTNAESDDPTWGTGYFGNGLTFDGSNDHIIIPNDDDFDFGQHMTLSAWVYYETAGNNKAIMSKWLHSSQDSWVLQTPNNGDPNRIRFFLASSPTDNGHNYMDTQPGSLPLGWSHVTVTFDGTEATPSDRVKIYINGVSQSLSDAGSMPAQVATTTSDIYISDLINWNRFWPGQIDEVKMFNRTLSPNEVTTLATPRSSLVAHWAFTDGSLDDKSPNNYDLTASGDPEMTSGYAQGGVTFDGSNYLSAGDIDLAEITVATWVYSESWSTQSHPMLMAKGINKEWILWKSDDGGANDEKFGFRLGPVAAHVYSDTKALNNTWQYVVGSYDGSFLRIYVNGILEDSVAYSGDIPQLNNGIQLGAGANGNRLRGSLDESRIYEEALSAAEIADLYHETAPHILPAALELDGHNQHVEIENPFYQFTDELTVEFWARMDGTSGGGLSQATKNIDQMPTNM